MIIYLVLGSAVFIFAMISGKYKFAGCQGKCVIFMEYLLLSLVSALRYDVGMDYANYLAIYYNPAVVRVNEKGYLFINDILVHLGLPVYLLIGLYAFATVAFAFKFIMRESCYPYLSIALFTLFSPFYLNSMNAVRQSLAVYMFLFAVRYIEKKQPYHYYFVMMMAVLFGHVSALICFPMYFILKQNYTRKTKILFIAAFAMSSKVIVWLASHTRYAFYLSNGTWGRLSGLYFIELAMGIFLAYKLRKSRSKNIQRNINILFIAGCVFCLLNQNLAIGSLFTRILMYFTPIILVLIPEYVKDSIYLSNRKIKYCVILAGFGLFFIMAIVLRGEVNHLVPYRTILTDG